MTDNQNLNRVNYVSVNSSTNTPPPPPGDFRGLAPTFGLGTGISPSELAGGGGVRGGSGLLSSILSAKLSADAALRHFLPSN